MCVLFCPNKWPYNSVVIQFGPEREQHIPQCFLSRGASSVFGGPELKAGGAPAKCRHLMCCSDAKWSQVSLTDFLCHSVCLGMVRLTILQLSCSLSTTQSALQQVLNLPVKHTHSCTDGRGYHVTGRPAHHKRCSTYTPKLPEHWWTPIVCNVGFSILAKLLRPLSPWLVEEPHERREVAGLNSWSRWDKVFEVSDFQFNVAVKQDDVCSPWMDKG